MNKDDAKNIMKNSDLDEKSGLLLKMGDKTTYYQRNRKNLSNDQKNIMKIIKKDWQRKEKLNIENYLLKEKIYKENIEEIDVIICLKKIDKD